MSVDGSDSIFNMKVGTKAVDFELADFWDEGEPLGGVGQEWQVCVILNLVRTTVTIGVCAHRITGISKITADSPLRRNATRRSIGPTSVALALSLSPSGTRLQSIRPTGARGIQLELMTWSLEMS